MPRPIVVQPYDWTRVGELEVYSASQGAATVMEFEDGAIGVPWAPDSRWMVRPVARCSACSSGRPHESLPIDLRTT